MCNNYMEKRNCSQWDILQQRKFSINKLAPGTHVQPLEIYRIQKRSENFKRVELYDTCLVKLKVV